jgi:rhodanese-related sulfurtransferase
VKKLGYVNIKIYNGGIKDWEKSNHRIVAVEPLPSCEEKFVTAEELLAKIKGAEADNCSGEGMNPPLVIVDLRTENHLNTGNKAPIIKTACPTIFCLLDDLRKKSVRNRIPKSGTVVTITETGNRDKFAQQYLCKFGYKNVNGLLFGMRGWIKANFPIDSYDKTAE